MGRAGRLTSRPVLIAVLAIALGLSACGRKGPLDAPPGAAVSRAPAPAEAAESAEKLRATPNSKRTSPLDWLLN